METIQASQHVKALRPPWNQATVVELLDQGIQQATNYWLKSPCHSAKTELPLDLLLCSTQVGPWVSLRLSSVQVQSDSLTVHSSSKPTDHCQIRTILRGAVNLSKTAQGTFFLTLSVAQRHLFLFFLQQIRWLPKTLAALTWVNDPCLKSGSDNNRCTVCLLNTHSNITKHRD